MLDVSHEELERPGSSSGARSSWRSDGALHRLVRRTFADVRAGELLVYEDAYRTLAVAVNRGNAAALLGPAGRRRAADRGGVSAPLGAPRVHHRRTDSTNARARELAAAGAPHGTLVTAGEQTAGPRAPGPSVERARRARRC